MTAKEYQAMLKGKGSSKPKKKRTNREHQLQKSCVEWFRLAYSKDAYLLWSTPNGASLAGNATQRGKQWNMLKAEGVLPGVADLFLAIPSGELHGLFIEMKTPRGKQSDVQKEFEDRVIDKGYGYAMPRDIDEFMRVVNSYLENGTY